MNVKDSFAVSLFPCNIEPSRAPRMPSSVLPKLPLALFGVVEPVLLCAITTLPHTCRQCTKDQPQTLGLHKPSPTTTRILRLPSSQRRISSVDSVSPASPNPRLPARQRLPAACSACTRMLLDHKPLGRARVSRCGGARRFRAYLCRLSSSGL